MIFLTFGEGPSGILVSQVIDVVKLLRDHFKKDVKLLCFISIRDFLKNRKYIQSYLPEAIVLPTLPRLRNWQSNYFLLRIASIFINTDDIIARGIWATNLALRLKNSGNAKKVCYDGRGAISAEVTEYSVIHDPKFLAEVPDAERKSVLESDYRIAVSTKLIDFWETEFNYQRGKEVVIPCTVSNVFQFAEADQLQKIQTSLRQKLNWDLESIVWVFSGSTAGWQSFEMLQKIFVHYLEKYPNLCILFLSKEDKNITKLQSLYPKRIAQKWLTHNEVSDYLMGCDYGIMIREQSITNKVASPTKFAEYLMSGLKVISSENLGDYSDFITAHNCGFVIKESEPQDIVIERVSPQEKHRLMQLSQHHFSKKSSIILQKYQQLVSFFTEKNSSN